MARQIDFPRINTGDKDLRLIQDNISAAFRALQTQSSNVRVLNSGGNILSSDSVLLITGNSFSIGLPDVQDSAGRVLTFKHIGTSLTQIYTIVSSGGLIAGSSTFPLYTNGEILSIVSDGANWYSVSRSTATGWIDYTPTFSGFGTVSTLRYARWCRVADSIEIQARWVNGTVDGNAAAMSLPTGVTADVPTTADNMVGTMGTQAATGNAIAGWALIGGSGSLTRVEMSAYAHNASPSLALSFQDGNDIVVTGAQMALNFKVKVLGWKP